MEEYYRLTLNETQWAILVNSLRAKWEAWKQEGDPRTTLAWQTYVEAYHAPSKSSFAPATVPGADCHRRSAKPDVTVLSVMLKINTSKKNPDVLDYVNSAFLAVHAARRQKRS